MWGKHPFVKGYAFTKMGVASKGSQHANKTNIFIWSPHVALSGNRRPQKNWCQKRCIALSHIFPIQTAMCGFLTPNDELRPSPGHASWDGWWIRRSCCANAWMGWSQPPGRKGEQESCWASAFLMNKHGGIMECIYIYNIYTHTIDYSVWKKYVNICIF